MNRERSTAPCTGSRGATAVFLPADETLEMTCLEPLEAVVISARAGAGGSPLMIEPDRVAVVERGSGGYAREVHNILVDAQGPQRLLVGETFNPAGNWSSFPPHKHDGADGEPALEEVYHFRIDPPRGFALQMLSTASGEEIAHVVRDGDAVRIPYGYHPVAAAPGYRLYYLWALAGQQRKLSLYEDPDHAWID